MVSANYSSLNDHSTRRRNGVIMRADEAAGVKPFLALCAQRS